MARISTFFSIRQFTKARSRRTLTHIVSAVLLASAFLSAQELGKRSEFTIPLVPLTLGNADGCGSLKKVKITIEEDKEYAVITCLNDTYQKLTRSGTEKTLYQEAPERSFMISDFEAKQLSLVVHSFISTLQIFEKDLDKQRWDRCLYLDSYFPRFLQRFYFLVCAARNSSHAMPFYAKIPDSEYDVSLNSPLSDKRIRGWQNEKDYVIKLRIISKELSYQLETWRKKELDNPSRNPEVAYSAKAEEALGLFIRMYFNVRPLPDVPTSDRHL